MVVKPQSNPARKNQVAFSLRRCRILEIADHFYFKLLLPDQTTFYSVARRDGPEDGQSTVLRHRVPLEQRKMTLVEFVRLVAALRRGDYDLVAVMPSPKPVWQPNRLWVINLAHLLGTLIRKFRLCGIYAIRFVQQNKLRLVVIDRHDEPTIKPGNFWLHAKCELYFKRELPQNHWNVFLHARSGDVDMSHVRRQPLYQQAIRRLRPLPMPTFIEPDNFENEVPEKTHDLFYAGNLSNATVRDRGALCFENLRRQGYRIDFLAGKVDYREYVERSRRAWLIWSPEGQGWQCRRHYEAIVLGSIPVINYPGIFQYKPLIHGEHCFYYGCEGDLLERTIMQALSDKERLCQMVRAAQNHLMNYFSREAMTSYIESELQTSIGA